MIKIDLITGFLGSGKTTFLKQYAKYLMAQGKNIGILENDFGAVNVDMLLLQELRGDQCELEMISGGCDKETHRRRFRTKLISMGMSGYDRILVEPSGIYDVDEFFDALHEEPLDKWYEIGNVIAIVDAKLTEDLSAEADYLLASEVADAGCVLLSRSQEATVEEISSTKEHLNRALGQIQCRRCLDSEILTGNWNDLTDTDLEKILNCGYVSEAYVKESYAEGGGFDSLFFMNVHKSEEKLYETAERILNDPSCGDVFRVKGFAEILTLYDYFPLTVHEHSLLSNILIILASAKPTIAMEIIPTRIRTVSPVFIPMLMIQPAPS